MDGKNLAVDAAALAVYAVVANPAVTGIALHEWLGLGLFVVFVVHAALHADWVADALRTAFSRPTLARTGNLVLDALSLVAFMACTVSGIMVSGDVLRAFGLYAEGLLLLGPPARRVGQGAAGALWWCTWPCMRSGSRPGSGRGRPAAREGGKRREPAVRRQVAGVVADGPLRPHGGRNGPLLNHATASPPPPDGGRASSPAFPATRRHVGSS